MNFWIALTSHAHLACGFLLHHRELQVIGFHLHRRATGDRFPPPFAPCRSTSHRSHLDLLSRWPEWSHRTATDLTSPPQHSLLRRPEWFAAPPFVVRSHFAGDRCEAALAKGGAPATSTAPTRTWISAARPRPPPSSNRRFFVLLRPQIDGSSSTPAACTSTPSSWTIPTPSTCGVGRKGTTTGGGSGTFTPIGGGRSCSRWLISSGELAWPLQAIGCAPSSSNSPPVLFCSVSGPAFSYAPVSKHKNEEEQERFR
jgi:hypothetical protein